MKIAARMSRISPSATMAMKVRADELKAQGKDVLSFAVGEPDFPTPDNVLRAAEQAMAAGATKYTAASGTTKLKQAIFTTLRQRLQNQQATGLQGLTKSTILTFIQAEKKSLTLQTQPSCLWITLMMCLRHWSTRMIYSRFIPEGQYSIRSWEKACQTGKQPETL